MSVSTQTLRSKIRCPHVYQMDQGLLIDSTAVVVFSSVFTNIYLASNSCYAFTGFWHAFYFSQQHYGPQGNISIL